MEAKMAFIAYFFNSEKLTFEVYLYLVYVDNVKIYMKSMYIWCGHMKI